MHSRFDKIAVAGTVVAGALAVLTAPAALAAPTVTQLADNVYTMSEFGYVSLVVVGATTGCWSPIRPSAPERSR